MSTAVLDDVTIDPDLISALDDLNERVECSFSDCDLQAVSLLKCPCGVGTETMCGPHTMYVITWQQSEHASAAIVFNESCLHSPPVKECSIVPIGQ